MTAGVLFTAAAERPLSHFVPYMRVHMCAIVSTFSAMGTARDARVVKAAAAEIKARRGHLEISQEELAHRANVHRSFVARVEVARSQPTLAVLVRIAEALEVDAGELVRSIVRRSRREA
jgi:ribosome-binding protein aMBF1 (putative translation factor)